MKHVQSDTSHRICIFTVAHCIPIYLQCLAVFPVFSLSHMFQCLKCPNLVLWRACTRWCLIAPTLFSLSCKVVPSHMCTKLRNILLLCYCFNEIAKVQWLEHMTHNWKVTRVGTMLGTKVSFSNEGLLYVRKGFFMADQRKALGVGLFVIHRMVIDTMAHVG